MGSPGAKEIWRNQYPFESHYFDINGFRMHYIDEQKGHRPNDPPREVMLMVHGNPTWSFYWRNLAIALREKYRVIAVDHIGCGLSDKPKEGQYSFRLEERITDLQKLVEHLDLHHITLIAHDWGGAVGMGTAVRIPERIDRLVLMNTAAFLSDRFPFRIRLARIPGFGNLAVQGLNLFCHAALRMATNDRKKFTKEVTSGYLAPYDNWANRLAVLKFVLDVPLSEKHPSYATLREIEEKLPIFKDRKICLIWGMLDWCFPPDFLKRFLQVYPDAEVHKIDDAGHYLIEDAQEQLIPIVQQFLENFQTEA